MFILVRPPRDVQPMAEMPQWLINAPRGMLEDGTPRTRLLKLARVVPEASGTILLPDWFLDRVERAERATCVITSRSTGPESPIPCPGVAETTRRLGGSSLDYYLLVLGSPIPVPLVMAQQPQKRGEASMPRGMIG
ncbi:hypothetical protein DER46DRAFT_619160 [Fusarium sp. MPI-SDFR-AT-0072]|nr:hypothetical protein DER46DRAFT_619160 [Fusarium sp. MPI-SDFR-AT-0072]